MVARDPRLDMAIKYHLAGLDGEAWALAAEIVAADDASPAALEFAATLRQAAGDHDAALAFADRAIAAAPARASAHFVRGAALEALGQLVNAEIAYRSAIARQQNYPVAWNNLGNVLDAQGRAADAVTAFETAIAQQPDYDTALNNLGATLAGQGRFAAAAQRYAKALTVDPGNRAAAINLAVAEVERGHAARGQRQLASLMRRYPDDREVASNALFSLHNIVDDPAELDQWHRAWGATQSAALHPGKPKQNPQRPLRVGYVSADFRRHSVAFFVEPLLRHHDPAATEVFVYANVAAPDEVTGRLQAHVRNWRSIVGLRAAQICDLIRTDDIDILVDLSGHTQGNRLDVFAARPAPLQLTGIGYPGSTGLATFDGRLCDGITDPVGAEHFSSESPFRLPAFHCYQPPADAPACRRKDDDGIVFGSFNKLAKLSDRTVALWARVLRESPTAKLKLKTKPLTEAETCADVIARFAREAVAADRLILSGWLPEDRDHLAAYNDIDIALDTFPYNGTTTTCEALWMGVPVVTRAGQTHAARVGASLLASIGHPEWAAGDDEAFVMKAVALANDRDGLRTLRAALREQVAASRLCDAVRYTRGLEAAYRALFSRVI